MKNGTSAGGLQEGQGCRPRISRRTASCASSKCWGTADAVQEREYACLVL